ncbi:MAG TPA: hypothetical protein VFF30_04750 [Nitrososphaerales archaeon]|nr:hypothetical protein [Nitrososphaerales archaeon]
MVNVSGQIQQLICSNSSQLVTQHQSLFETLWSRAILATTRFNEINESEVTEVVYGLEQTSAVILRAINGVSEFAYTINEKSMPTITVAFPEYWDAYVRKQRTQPNADLRYLTEITKENMAYVKELMKVLKVRHLEGIVGSFWISQGEYFASLASNGLRRKSRSWC